ncbi:MAG: DUF362 domain-containing protein [Deltaproteobacteria bacterium]|nr:DUF362 domain-containing protein [Deltaproteobacteria bacterium]MBW1993511.1 DUF362 domain-containing protein [Deltaproteobacteria bacterium]
MNEIRSTVAIVKRETIPGTPSAYSAKELAIVKEMIDEAVSLIGGFKALIKTGDRVFIKPNIFSAQHPDQATITDPRVLEATVQLVKDMGAVEIQVGENPAIALARDVMEANGLGERLRRYGMKVVYLDQQPHEKVTVPGADVMHEVDFPECVLKADRYISLPKMKTHAMTLVTLGIKNSLGLLPEHEKKGRLHHEAIHQKLVDIMRIKRPDLVVLDGIIAGEGQGPIFIEPVPLKLILSSTDTVALDAVASSIMGLDPFEVTTTRIAHTAGLGTADLNNISIRGRQIDEVRRSFKRAVHSPIGFAPNAHVYVGGGCVVCQSIARFALDKMKMDGILESAGEFSLAIGTNPPVPEAPPGKLILLGDCVPEDIRHRGIFLDGCPAFTAARIIDALGISVPQQLWKDDYRRQKAVIGHAH